MIIAIYLHPFGEKKPAGLARLAYEIARSIIAADQENKYLILLKKKPNFLPNFPGNNWQIQILGHKYLWLTTKFRQIKADLTLFVTPVIPIFFAPRHSIVIVCDFAYKYLPDHSVKARLYHYFLNFVNWLSLKKASVIVAVSEFTKSEIMKFFRINPKKIKIIYIGFNKLKGNSMKPVIDLPKPYFLFVGVIKERKNVFNLVKAFGEFKKTDVKDLHLVIAGKGGGEYQKQIERYIQDQDLKNSVVFRGYVSDQELVHLYENAEAFIFPSLVEGFGMPILEAMDHGLPVITSNRGATKEAAGDAALLVDPENIYELASAMKEILNPQLKKELIEKGRQRVGLFSWETEAQKYVDLFKKFSS